MFCNLDAIAYLGVLAIDSRWIQLNVKCETKTKDNVFVNVVASVQYRTVADKASDAFYKLTNKREQIQSYVFDVIRASVPKLEPDTSLSRRMIAKAVEDELEKAMSTYANDIVQTLIVDIEPDVNVKRAMNEINAVRTGGKDDSIAEWTTDIADVEVWVDAAQASELRAGRRSPISSH